MLVLISHVPLKRVFATARSIAQLAYVSLPPVDGFFVSLYVAFAAELLVTLTAYPTFLLFSRLLLPQSRSKVARGWRGAFKLQLVDSRRETHISLFVRLPICGTTFARRFTERQLSDRCGEEARVGRGYAGSQVAQILCVTWFSVRLPVEDLFKGFIVVAEELVAGELVVHVLSGHKASGVVSTQTIVQLTLDGNSSWVSLSCNPLPQKLSSEYKSFDRAIGWSQFCDVLLIGMHCIITQVSDHVVKRRGMAGLNADPLVSENWQWFLNHCHHSPFKVLKKNASDTSRRRGEGLGEVHVGRYAFRPPFLFPRTCCVRLVARNR